MKQLPTIRTTFPRDFEFFKNSPQNPKLGTLDQGLEDRRWFEDRVRARRVFIVGAGFSAAAGVPLTKELLRESLQLFSIECPGIYSRVEGYAEEALGSVTDKLDIDQISFSELCTFLEFNELREYGGDERWCENGSREKLALRFYLAKTIVRRTPVPEDIPQLYRAFAAQLNSEDVVISFNWDGLLEMALEAEGKPYTYDRSIKNVVRIWKLHGSVNWHLGEPRHWREPRQTLRWKKLDFGSRMTRPMYCTPELLRLDTWLIYPPLGEVDPYLVLPGYGKAFDVRAIAPLWYKPEFAFAVTHDVYIIGLSLAHDDFFVRSFFLSNLPYLDTYSGVPGRRIIVINPSDVAHMDYDFILSRGRAELWNEHFCIEHVERICSHRGGADK